MNNKTKHITSMFLSALLAFICAVSLIACNRKSPAVLHDEGSKNVISYAEEQIDVKIKSPQSFVYDVSNDTIIYSKGSNEVVYPGSISKLLTILYAMEILPLDEVIAAKDELELVKPHSSIAYIKEGHKLTVEMLIEGMLLPSGNDAAYVLSAACGRKLTGDFELKGEKAVEIFMKSLNEYGRKIGLCGTNFTAPDGYAEDDHYTTTEDVLIISKLAYENSVVRKYSGMLKDSVVYASGHTNDWKNTNKMLDPGSEFYCKYVNGLKTGSIDNEYSLVFTFRFDDGREYICGVFGGREKDFRFRDALEIIEVLKNK